MSTIPEAIRQQVRERADRRCEYCLKPEGFSLRSHHVDHIVAQKHDGSDAINNLAWACFQCNVQIGSDIASYDRETSELTPLYNPRTQNWETHFEMDGPLILGQTPEGRVTIRILRLNHVEQVELRQNLIDAGRW